MYCHVNVSTGSRGTGQSAAAKYDYISRAGKYEAACQDEVVHLESGSMPSFASSDARLYWAAADCHERSNGRLFRSLTAALPNSLDPAGRLELARSFAAHVTSGELPYTLAVHAGESKKEGVADNPHLHLVFSERVNDGVERGAAQWFRRAAPKKGDPASGGARKTERTKPRAWLEETRSAWAGKMNLAFEQAGVSDRVTSESHATQLARAREAGDAAEEVRLLLNPPSLHIGPPAKHNWEDRPGRAPELKPDRYAAAEAAAASAEEVRSAHAPDVAEVAEARSRVAALDARIAALEAEVAAGERRAKLAEREEAVRATSKGGQWLDEAHQSALARGDGRLTPGERERAVETVEDRLRADLAAREASLMATSTGSTLLREEYGEAVAAAAAAQSFAKRESVLERVAQRVDEELGAREEALRSIPLGRQHLSAAEQVRADGAVAAPPTPAERESMVRAAEQRVGEALARREERVLAATGDDRLLAEAAEELAARDAVSGDGGIAEQARVIDRAEDLLEADRTELELEEADLRKDTTGEEFLRNARVEVLGAADRETQTLVDGWAVIDQASAAKARVEALGIGGMDLYHAHLADIDPKWGVDGNAATTRGNQDAALSAAESDGARLGRVRAVLSDEAAAARYREVLDDGPDRFDTADLNRALAAGERERQEREATAWAGLAAREESVRATSKGGQWLDEAHQSVLADAGGRLARERAVEAVEGRLRADLGAREESLMATSTGSTLLREEYGEGGAADAPRRSFAERESVLERVAQRVDEDLGAREEALRSIALGRRHLSAAEQARAGGAADAPPPPAERESMVRAADQRVGEDLDRREERVLAATGDDRLLAEAAEELAARGAVFGDGGFEEQALIIDQAEDLLEGERAGLELEEGKLLKAAAGEELLRNARRDVLGDDDRDAETLTDGWAVIEQASAAKARVEALGTGGLDLYHAHLADIDAEWGVDGNAATTRGNQDAALSAAESDGSRLGRLRAVRSDEAAAARYREVLGDSPDRFDTADLDRALAAGEREREERAAAARRAADLETATEAAQAAAARSKVDLRPAAVRAVYETGETHAAGLAAVERTTEALDAAADQRLPAGTIIDAWKANRSAPGGIAAALATATAAARLEEERAEARRKQAAIEKRNSRVKQLLADPVSADALIEALEAEDPSWRSGIRPACIDRALDVAERDPGPREVATRRHHEHEVVLETERRFPDATSTACQFAGGRFDVTTEVGRAGRRVSQDLSDRALVRAHAAEKAEAPAPRNFVQRLYEWLRDRLERLLGRSPGPSAAASTPGPAASAERPAEAGRPRPAAFEERYCREWPEHAADIRRPDFEKLAAGALSGNRLFEREEPRSSRWITVEPGELPAALAKPQPAWSDKAVEEVTRRATVWDPDRTEGRRVAEAHLGGYESRLPAEYSHSAEWQAILKRAEEAVRKAQNSWRYKWADRRKDDRKKRELEATAINRACGRDARRLHGKMMAGREAARPEWEVTVRIRAVQELIRSEEAARLRQEQARERARERERATDRPPPERKRTRDRGRGLDR